MAPASVSPYGAIRILVVEDDPNSAFLLQKILLHTSHKIAGVARTGDEAVEMAEKTRPDIILMDINIPGAFDGVEAAARIMRKRDVPVIYLTAVSDDVTVERARRTGPFAYLLKPYREKEVLITIEMALYKERLDQQRKASEQRLAATLGAIQDCVLTFDAAGHLTYLNPAAINVLGGTAASDLGKPVSELLDLRERETRTRLSHLSERLLKPGFATDPANPLLLMTSAEEPRLVQIQVNALTDHEASAERVVIMRDVTELSRLQDSVSQTQKLEAVGRLAGGIAHDFNNLLAIINSFAELLLIKAKPNDPNEKFYRNIRNAGQRGAELVSRLMTFSRNAPFSPRLVELDKVVHEMHRMLRPLIRENIELVTEVPPGLPRLHIDPGQIEQIVLNLCLNARDAIAEEGRITISLEMRPGTECNAATSGAKAPANCVALSVSDTGCGMEADVRRKIFEPFFTTKDVGKGTGLGLAMVYNLVKQNGGRIEVQSEVNVGTTFTILLPAAEAVDDGPRESEQTLEPAPGGNERVLLVEDDPNFADCVKSLLEMNGYTTVTAKDGEDGRRRFHEHAGKFDLLLTDLVLPKLSGNRLAEELRRERPGLRVLFMSGYDDADSPTKPGAGVARLQKPFSLNTLLARVRELLDGPVNAVR